MKTNNTDIQFTKYTSKNSALSKSYSVTDEKITKQAAAQMSAGTATIVTLPFSKFLAELQRADSATAFGYGIPNDTTSNIKQIVTKKQLANNPDAISRSKDFFSYSESAGILMIDYDPDSNNKTLSIAEFLDILSIIIPGFSDIAYIVRGSISSCVQIKNSANVKLKGFHLYIPVVDSSDIPRFGAVLFKLLWLNGYGYIAHSDSGALLIRTPTDAMVYSPERLDFVGKPILNDSSLHYVQPALVINNGHYLDTKTLKDLTNSELGEYENLVSIAKKPAEKIGKKIKSAWKKNKKKKLIEAGNSPQQVNETIEQLNAVRGQPTVLPTHFILHFQEFGEISVEEVLNNPEKFNDQALADPIEGVDYGESTAKLWINDGTPIIHSFAHGSTLYHLPAKNDGIKKPFNKKVIRLDVGEKKSIIDQCIQVLVDDEQLYVYSGQLVQIIRDKSTGGNQENKALKIMAIEALSLTEILMSLVKFMKKNSKGDWIETNLAIDYSNTLLARNSWAIQNLAGIIYTPSLGKDGTLITKNGYDVKSGLYLDYDASKFPALNKNPTLADAKKSLDILKDPFQSFPFKAESDLSTVIAAILTGLIRHSFGNAPLFLVTSPKMGTGKGLIISAIAQLVTGKPASVMSQASDSNEERKRLFAALLEGDSMICIDNIEKTFSSDALCSILTMPVFKDRLLGKSQMISVSTQATFLATGNNVTVSGDLPRRVLPCSIDAQVEKPYEREFTINLPLFIKKNRGPIVNAALTILSAYQTAGCPNQKLKSFGSFEEWSNTVRSALVWSGMADPCLGLQLWDQVDPARDELSNVLESWYEIIQSSPMTISELLKLANRYLSDEYRANHTQCSHSKEKIENLYNALFNICEKNGRLNPAILSAWIRKKMGNIESSYVLENAGTSGTRKKYKITKYTNQ